MRSTSKTWGVVLGCKRVSAGCDNCYAIRTAHRLAHNPNQKIGPLYAGLTDRTADSLDWTGIVRTVPGRLGDPLKWRKPERIFVNSQSDLFHPAVPIEFIQQVFAVMAATPQHTYQILTKRPDIARKILADICACGSGHAPGVHFRSMMSWHGTPHSPTYVPGTSPDGFAAGWPLPNVWIGTSVEDQVTADTRIPKLLQVPAAVRWISAEPLLGPVDLSRYLGMTVLGFLNLIGHPAQPEPRLDWVVAGGESGPGARPMHPAWARSIRDQCETAGVPFLFKQRGAWSWDAPERPSKDRQFLDTAGKWRIRTTPPRPEVAEMWHVGKKTAGRLLDGVEYNGYPQAAA